MNRALPTPTPALAHRLLQPVAAQDRLVGYRIDFRRGAEQVDLLSLVDVLALLQLPDPRLDLGSLASWCEGVLHDPDLAASIRAVADAPGTPPTHRRITGELIEVRLLQSARIAGTVRLIAEPDQPTPSSGDEPATPGLHRRSKLG